MGVKPLDVWDDITPATGGPRGTYIAISGNTGAGKSSLISLLEHNLQAKGIAAIGVSERLFHHRYLKLMFADPLYFAFPIQLSDRLCRTCSRS